MKVKELIKLLNKLPYALKELEICVFNDDTSQDLEIYGLFGDRPNHSQYEIMLKIVCGDQ